MMQEKEVKPLIKQHSSWIYYIQEERTSLLKVDMKIKIRSSTTLNKWHTQVRFQCPKDWEHRGANKSPKDTTLCSNWHTLRRVTFLHTNFIGMWDKQMHHVFSLFSLACKWSSDHIYPACSCGHLYVLLWTSLWPHFSAWKDPLNIFFPRTS